MISIISVFPPYRGGISKFSDYLYKNLRKDEEVLAFNYSKLYPSVLFPGATQLMREDFEPYAKRLIHSYNPLNWRKAAKQIAGSNPGQVLISYWHPFFAPVLIKITRYLKKMRPEVNIHVLAHNVLPHESFPFGKMLSEKLLNEADTVIVLSNQSLLETKQLNISINVHKLFHPVYKQPVPKKSRKELRKLLDISDDEIVFLFFGLVRRYKGLDLFIEALNQIDLHKYKIRPMIAGEFYVDKDELLDKIRSSHRNLYIVEDHFLLDHEVAEVFTLADVLVMPYRSATQSGILANAINFKKPFIISDLSGLTEFLVPDKYGKIIPKENIPELRQAIIALTDGTLLAECSNNIEDLEKQLSWKRFTSELLAIIKK